jgi:hypothetical protein
MARVCQPCIQNAFLHPALDLIPLTAYQEPPSNAPYLPVALLDLLAPLRGPSHRRSVNGLAAPSVHINPPPRPRRSVEALEHHHRRGTQVMVLRFAALTHESAHTLLPLVYRSPSPSCNPRSPPRQNSLWSSWSLCRRSAEFAPGLRCAAEVILLRPHWDRVKSRPVAISWTLLRASHDTIKLRKDSIAAIHNPKTVVPSAHALFWEQIGNSIGNVSPMRPQCENTKVATCEPWIRRLYAPPQRVSNATAMADAPDSKPGSRRPPTRGRHRGKRGEDIAHVPPMLVQCNCSAVFLHPEAEQRVSNVIPTYPQSFVARFES